MIRRKGPILAAAVIAAFALGWYRGLFGVDQVAPTTTTPAAPTAADTAGHGETQPSQAENRPASGAGEATSPSAQPPASAETPMAKQAEAGPEAQGAAPGFDVVRVEPDGSAVVAGKGAANEAITLTDGTRTLGEARTDANGDFVMTLSLPTGSHRLQLAQRDDVVSDDAAVVNVPPAGKPDQLLVMMQRPGEASEIIQRPEEAPATVAAAEPARPSPGEPTPAQGEPQAQVAAVSPPTATAEAPRGAPAAEANLSVEAVEIEGDRLFVAGSARNGPTIRIYLDDQPVAEARSGAGDRFIASAKADVAVGDHTIRADALDAGGRVVGRVEVPFQRPEGKTMAAVAAPPGSGRDSAPAASPDQASLATPSVGEAANPSTSADMPVQGEPPAASGTVPAPAAGEPERAPVATAPAPAPAPAATPGEPQAVRQAPLQASPSRVIIRRGDTLWRISRETYGRGSRYTVIYLANGDQIRDPDRIYPGQVFRMPDGEEPASPPRG